MRILIMLSIVALGCDVIESPERAGQIWHTDDVPIIDIHDGNGAGEPAVLHGRGGTILSSGVIVVADEYAPALRFFDSKGNLVRTTGRKGDGPGEFRDIRWIGQCSRDSLFVYEYTRSVMTVFDSTGRPARDFRLAERPMVLSCSKSGRIVLLGPSVRYEEPAADPPQVPGPLSVVSANGQDPHVIDTFPIWQNRPLGRISSIAASDDRIYVATAESAFVEVLRLADEVRTSFRVADSTREAFEHHKEAAIVRLTSGLPNPIVREHFTRLYETLPLPERAPPYSGIILDPIGMLWVNTSLPGDPTTELVAYDSAGGRVGGLVLPGSVLVWEVGSDYVLGSYYDDMGSQHIVQYMFERSTPAGR